MSKVVPSFTHLPTSHNVVLNSVRQGESDLGCARHRLFLLGMEIRKDRSSNGRDMPFLNNMGSCQI